MKKNYIKPTLISESFEPETYCATCNKYVSSSGTNVNFECDLTTGWDDWGLNWTGYTLYDNNKSKIGQYDRACDKEHYVDSSNTNTFQTGYIRKNLLGYPSGDYKAIVYWFDGSEYHCALQTTTSDWATYTHS